MQIVFRRGVLLVLRLAAFFFSSSVEFSASVHGTRNRMKSVANDVRRQQIATMIIAVAKAIAQKRTVKRFQQRNAGIYFL